jgi:hypothetical protein
MEYLSFILYTLIFISILTPVAIVTFEFFDVKFETYGNYLLWFMALALFNALLPVRPKDIFNSISKPLEKLINNAKSIGNDVIPSAEKPAENLADNLPPTSEQSSLETNVPILSNVFVSKKNKKISVIDKNKPCERKNQSIFGSIMDDPTVRECKKIPNPQYSLAHTFKPNRDTFLNTFSMLTSGLGPALTVNTYGRDDPKNPANNIKNQKYLYV